MRTVVVVALAVALALLAAAAVLGVSMWHEQRRLGSQVRHLRSELQTERRLNTPVTAPRFDKGEQPPPCDQQRRMPDRWVVRTLCAETNSVRPWPLYPRRVLLWCHNPPPNAVLWAFIEYPRRGHPDAAAGAERRALHQGTASAFEMQLLGWEDMGGAPLVVNGVRQMSERAAHMCGGPDRSGGGGATAT